MPVSTAPTAFVIFGGGGDLTWRKLVPALYNLWLDGAVQIDTVRGTGYRLEPS